MRLTCLALVLLLFVTSSSMCCAQSVDVLETRADGSVLLAHSQLSFSDARLGKGPILRLLPDKGLQRMDGFGASLTESSASLLIKLPQEQREQVMREFFDPNGPLGLTLLREPIGASDFSAHGDYSYDDVPVGKDDPALAHFSVAPDETDVFPLLREALNLNPSLRLMILPWSAPAWMKSSHSMNGGSLQENLVIPYAKYLARTVDAYAAQGLPVYAMALQNEPLNENLGYPTQRMSAKQEVELAAQVRPLLRADRRTTLLLGYEHNWNNLDYPRELLSAAAQKQTIAGPSLFDGISFHCYAGSEAAQLALLQEHPGLHVWFTECSGVNGGSFGEDLLWQAKHLLLGAPLNGARSVMLWNLILDSAGGPHNGGCGDCRALLTLDHRGGQITLKRNPEFYILAHASPFVHPGAQQIETSVSGDSSLKASAYRNHDGTLSVLLLNSGPNNLALQVALGTKSLKLGIHKRSLVTLHWGTAEPVVEEGTYRLALAAQKGQCVEAAVEASAPALAACSSRPSQLWSVSLLAQNKYELRNVVTGQNLSLSPAGQLSLMNLDGDHVAPVELRQKDNNICLVSHGEDICTDNTGDVMEHGTFLRLLAPETSTLSDKNF